VKAMGVHGEPYAGEGGHENGAEHGAPHGAPEAKGAHH
jgi:hypothetical protein